MKQDAPDETDGERGKTKKVGGGRERRESKEEAGNVCADVPLLTHAPLCQYDICKPAALLDAKHH